MGLFSKSPTEQESTHNAISTFSSEIIKMDDISRDKIAPKVNSILKDFIDSLPWSEGEKVQAITMFQILSGTVGFEDFESVEFQDSEIYQFISESLPFQMPLVIMGPIRMVIEEFITGKEMKDIDYESFDLTDARKIVNSLMNAINAINERCVQNPKKHTKNEILAIARIAEIAANHFKI